MWCLDDVVRMPATRLVGVERATSTSLALTSHRSRSPFAFVTVVVFTVNFIGAAFGLGRRELRTRPHLCTEVSKTVENCTCAYSCFFFF